MDLKSAKLLAVAGVLAIAAPASAATTFVMVTFKGVLKAGVDNFGVLGTRGAKLGGVPFTYSFVWRTIDEDHSGPGSDYTAPIIKVSGKIGDLRIPYQSANGFMFQAEAPEGPFLAYGYPGDIHYPAAQFAKYYPYPNEDFPADISQYDLFVPPLLGGHLFASGENVTFSFRSGSAVPEPAVWAMMLLGFGAIGLFARRSRQTRVAVCYT